MHTVLIHGLTGGPESWDAVVNHWNPEESPQRLTLPGHQGTAPVIGVFADTLAWLEARIEHRGDALRVVGYSLGARLAMGLLSRLVLPVAEVVLVGGHPGLVEEDARLERRRWDQTWAKRLHDHGVEDFVNEWEGLPLFSSQKRLAPEVRDAHRRRRLGHSASGLAWAFECLGLGSMPSWWEGLADFDGKLVVMAGEGDKKYCALGAEVASRVARGEFQMVAECGHDLLLEAPEAVADCLSRLEGGREMEG